MLRKAAADWQISPSAAASNDLTTCVRRFGVPNPVEPWKGELTKHIVSAKLSPERPSDLLVSYSDDAMYLFDTDSETYTRPPKPRQPQEDEMWRGGETMADERDDDPESEHGEDATDVMQDLVEKEDSDDSEEDGGPATMELGAGPADTLDLEEDENGVSDDDEEDDDDNDSEVGFDPYVPNAIAPASDVPMIAPKQKYEGHANSQVSSSKPSTDAGELFIHPLVVQTVKDCNWLSGDLVVSGSDDGNWFAYDRNSGEVRGIFKGDSSVSTAPHKRDPKAAADARLPSRWSTSSIRTQDFRSSPSAGSTKS